MSICAQRAPIPAIPVIEATAPSKQPRPASVHTTVRQSSTYFGWEARAQFAGEAEAAFSTPFAKAVTNAAAAKPLGRWKPLPSLTSGSESEAFRSSSRRRPA